MEWSAAERCSQILLALSGEKASAGTHLHDTDIGHLP